MIITDTDLNKLNTKIVNATRNQRIYFTTNKLTQLNSQQKIQTS